MSTEKISKNLKRCSRFESCSIPICPTDFQANQRVYHRGENKCPFTIKKKKKSQKGIRTLAHDNVLKLVPQSNLKILNKRNQKRWYALHQKT